MTSSYDILDISEVSSREIVTVINDAFGRCESQDWYRWKHREGPWGPSIGVAAVDDTGPIGVRLLLPWRLMIGGRFVHAHRATEAATRPQAQGRGVFTALNRWMMEQVETELIFSTPNLNSRGGYLKLGWREIGRVTHRWEIATRPRQNHVMAPGADASLGTAWDEAALSWRTDSRSGHRYDRVTADGAELHYRVLRRSGLRVVAPLTAASEPRAASSLWRLMLTKSRAHAVLRPASQPKPTSKWTPGLNRGESLILGWFPGNGSSLSEHPHILEGAPWCAADLEGVI